MATIPFALGTTDPRQTIQVPASQLDATTGLPTGSSDWYNPAGTSGDLLSNLNSLTGLTAKDYPTYNSQGQGEFDPVSGSWNGPAPWDTEQLRSGFTGYGQDYEPVIGADGQPTGNYKTTYGDPTGSENDVWDAEYTIDASGNATPVSNTKRYDPSSWVSTGRDFIKGVGLAAGAGSLASIAAGGTALGTGGASFGSGGGLGPSWLGGSAVAPGADALALGDAAAGLIPAGQVTPLTAAELAAGGGSAVGAGALPAAGAAAGAGVPAAVGTAGTVAAGAGAAGSLIPGVSNGQLLTLGGAALAQGLNQPPAAPDAGALIQQQTAANQQAAEVGASINRPDINTPFGSQTWSRVADPSQPGGFRYIQNNTLSAGEQQLYDADTANKIAKQGIASGLQGAAANAVSKPFDLSGQPAMRTSISDGKDYAAQRDQVVQSLYDQGARLLKPGQDQALEQQDAQLRNQGLMPGTQAYDNALQALRQNQMLQMNDLQDRAVQQGGAEQSRLAGLDLTSANFGNTARQNSIQEALLQRTQPLAELNSFTSGAAPTTPTFQPFGSQAVAPANTQAASLQQSQGEMNSYNARQAQLQSLLNLGTSIFATPKP